jgi:hypothetical protein
MHKVITNNSIYSNIPTINYYNKVYNIFTVYNSFMLHYDAGMVCRNNNYALYKLQKGGI